MTLDDLTLTDNLIWPDEFQHNQLAQSVERSLTGGLIVQEGAKQYGRPITLEGWLSRDDVDALYAKEASASSGMPLTLPDGREFTVIFDRARGRAIEAEPVHPYTQASQTPEWYYQTTIRLLTVEPPTP